LVGVWVGVWGGVLVGVWVGVWVGVLVGVWVGVWVGESVMLMHEMVEVMPMLW
jgi:hypothetical protein